MRLSKVNQGCTGNTVWFQISLVPVFIMIVPSLGHLAIFETDRHLIAYEAELMAIDQLLGICMGHGSSLTMVLGEANHEPYSCHSHGQQFEILDPDQLTSCCCKGHLADVVIKNFQLSCRPKG